MTDSAAQWITFLTVLIGFIYQAYRENRQRRWDKEDRADLAAKVIKEAGVLSSTAAIVASDAKVERIAHTDKLLDAISENTKISTKAFKESNQVNNKLKAIGEERLAVLKKRVRPV